MIKFILVTSFLLIASNATAQTVVRGPVDISVKIEWELPLNMTAPEGLLFEPRIRDSSQPNFVALAGFTCAPPTGTNPKSVCRVPLTPTLVTQFNVIGKHNITLSLFRTDVGESPLSTPFSLTSPSDAPTSLQLTR